MILYGITGGIGMGKSTAGNFLLQWGLPLVDTDDIARTIVAPGEPALDELRQAFGPSVLSPQGALNRSQLASIVFNDPTARAKLESILHPRIRQVWLGQVEEWRAQERSVGFVTIPLLFETGAEHWFDEIVCVACSSTTQFERLRSRGWTDEAIRQRLNSQWSVKRKMEAATFVVWTDTSLDVHAAQWLQFLDLCFAAPGDQ